MRSSFLALLSLVAFTACALTPRGSPALRAGDLLVLDADSGARTADGSERLGQLFVSRALADGTYAPIELLAEDPRWIEPLELLVLPNGDVLVLESVWSEERGVAAATAVDALDASPATASDSPAGALFRVRTGVARSVSLLTSPRAWRLPVGLARHADGRLFVTDREADPLGLGVPTGCVWVFEADAFEGEPALAAAGSQLVTPGPMAFDGNGALLIMDADANPLALELPGGRTNTPGVLYRLEQGALEPFVVPTQTISPIGLVRTEAGELLIVDANFGWGPRIRGDGALFRVVGNELELVLDSVLLGRPGALLDPVDGDTLPDGRVLLADGNVDPLGLGPDDTGKGVHGTGPGAILVADLRVLDLSTLLADARFVSPMCVRRVR